MINNWQCQALKWLSNEYFLKFNWFESWGSVLQRPVWEGCGKERLRDLTLLMYPPALIAVWVLAELQSLNDSSTRFLQDRLVFPGQWFCSCHTNCQIWCLAGGMTAYPPKSLHMMQRHSGSQSTCTHNINRMFPQSPVKPCQMYGA